MPYVLGVDIGNSFTTAAAAHVSRENHRPAAHPVKLGLNGSPVPSVVFVTDDGQVLVGEAAEAAGICRPERMVRQFRQRIGDPVPIVVGDLRFAAEEVFADLVRWVVDRTEELEGAPPDAISITHPTSWGDYKIAQVRGALASVDLGDVTLVSEPEAAVRNHATSQPDEPGGVIAVYDLGGSTFSVSILEENASNGFRMLGEPGHIEQLGGADFDELVFRRVAERAGCALSTTDPSDEDAFQAFRDARRVCTTARETLSFRTEVIVPVAFPGVRATVRLVRAEFEAMIDGTVRETIDLLEQTLQTAGLTAEDLTAVLLVGGASRTPFVARQLAENLDRPIVSDSDPAAFALGAAEIAAMRVLAAWAAEASVDEQAGALVEHPAPNEKKSHGVRHPLASIAWHRFRLSPKAAQASAKAVPVGVAAVLAGMILTVVAAQGAGLTALSHGDNGRPDAGAGEWFKPESLRADGIPGFPFGASTSEPEAEADVIPFFTLPPSADATDPGPQPKRSTSGSRQQGTDEATRASARPPSPQPGSTNTRTEPASPPDPAPEPPPEPAPEPEPVPDPIPDPPSPNPDPAPDPDPDPAPDPAPAPDPDPAAEPDPVPEPEPGPVNEPAADPGV